MANKVGPLIKEARTGAGMTQEQLAKKIKGITAADISKAERGELELTQTVLKEIAKYTGVTQSSLINAAKESTYKSASKSTSSKSSSASKSSSGTSAKAPQRKRSFWSSTVRRTPIRKKRQSTCSREKRPAFPILSAHFSAARPPGRAIFSARCLTALWTLSARNNKKRLIR